MSDSHVYCNTARPTCSIKMTHGGLNGERRKSAISKGKFWQKKKHWNKQNFNVTYWLLARKSAACTNCAPKHISHFNRFTTSPMGNLKTSLAPMMMLQCGHQYPIISWWRSVSLTTEEAVRCLRFLSASCCRLDHRVHDWWWRGVLIQRDTSLGHRFPSAAGIGLMMCTQNKNQIYDNVTKSPIASNTPPVFLQEPSTCAFGAFRDKLHTHTHNICLALPLNWVWCQGFLMSCPSSLVFCLLALTCSPPISSALSLLQLSPAHALCSHLSSGAIQRIFVTRGSNAGKMFSFLFIIKGAVRKVWPLSTSWGS